MNKQEKIIILLFSIFLLVDFFIFQDLPFFGDAVSKSQRADWIFSNHFSTLIIPTELNSGHPPLWITSIALFWSVFGKTIWSARMLLMLVNFGVFYQILVLAKNAFRKDVSIYLVLLILIEPTLIAQTTSLNNDMLLLFFTLLGINSLFKNRDWLYTIALVGLLLTNLRGIYTSIALILIHIWLCKTELLTYNKKMIKAYVIGFTSFFGFMFYQYSELGWFLITKNEGFSEHRKLSGLSRILKNSAAYIKNLLDFGRLVVWIPLFFFVIKFVKLKSFKTEKESAKLLIALVVFTTVFFLGFVPFSNPFGPRYMLVCYILANVLFINLLFQFVLKKNIVKAVISIVVIAFVTGHFWIYPSTIAQGWDSSLAYLNYFPQEKKMFQYLEENDIPKPSIGTNLYLNSRWISNLTEPPKEEDRFISLDLERNEYILFSNLENRTEDEDIITLNNSWIEVKTCSQLGVFLTLYKNPN
jgi:4-amino-4-deoxy-L-arabinose transferase-like glycosyltransferase